MVQLLWDLTTVHIVDLLSELVVTVRDDGPGALSREDLAAHRLTERLATVDGALNRDAIPGWGSTSSRTSCTAAATGRSRSS
ncbi:MAG: hypothetical protein ACRDJ9_22085 [Dehalococcoidia bacterium]